MIHDLQKQHNKERITMTQASLDRERHTKTCPETRDPRASAISVMGTLRPESATATSERGARGVFVSSPCRKAVLSCVQVLRSVSRTRSARTHLLPTFNKPTRPRAETSCAVGSRRLPASRPARGSAINQTSSRFHQRDCDQVVSSA